MYITPAQLAAATMAKGRLAGGIGRGFAAGEVSGGKGCWPGAMGFEGVDGEVR